MKRRLIRDFEEEFDKFVAGLVVELVRMDAKTYLKVKLMLLSNIQEDSSLTSDEKVRLSKLLDIIFKEAEQRRPLLIEMKGDVVIG